MTWFTLISFLLYKLTSSQTCTTATSDTVPPSPSISVDTGSLSPAISPGYSELITTYTMDSLSSTITGWPRTSCPHEQSGLLNFHEAATWASTSIGNRLPLSTDTEITLPTNSKVIIRDCTFDYITNSESQPLQRIIVPASSELIFDDAEITIHVREILVYGTLSIGSETCRLYSNIDLIFYGDSSDSSLSNSDLSKTSKGIMNLGGLLQIHGKQFHPTWTRLSRIANAGDTVIFLQDSVNWEVGQEIVVVTSVWLDCPAEYQEEWCKPCYSWQTCDSVPHQNEVKIIQAVDTSPEGYSMIELDSALVYEHYASSEYQTEVALLSRRIQIMGYDSGDKFGVHTLTSNDGVFQVQGTSVINGGQLNVLGRYPFHAHLNGEDTNSQISYWKDNTIRDSFWRALVIHGTNYTTVSRNVAYNIWGMGFYLEDGVEEGNLFEYNLGAHIHPVHQPANGNGGQGGETFTGFADLVVPADTSASAFYISNAANTYIGNAASGGWSGFAWPNLETPVGTYWGSAGTPQDRPPPDEDSFLGNTAHSSGHYWHAHGACMYVGALLTSYDDGVTLTYNSGRNSRQTQSVDGSQVWMYYKHTKTWLCNRGINHWGDRAIINYYESHDNLRSAVTFGESAMDTALVNARSDNTLGQAQQDWRYQDREGFQFYDTHVKTVLQDVTFRGFNQPEPDVEGDRVIRYMDHSDQFLPQGINSVSGITYEDCDSSAYINLFYCGDLCAEDRRETMSSRMAAVYDIDGSLTQSYVPSLVGSHRDWWKHPNNPNTCNYYTLWNVWRCDLTDENRVAFFEPYIPGIFDGCDVNSPLNTDSGDCVGQSTPYTVGKMSQFGTGRYIELSPWTGVAGFSNTGWLWTTPWGSPNYFELNDFQIPRGNFVVLAIKYPTQAEFSVSLKYRWWSFDDVVLTMDSDYSNVMSLDEDLLDESSMTCGGNWYDYCSNTGGQGPRWYFDSNTGYLYIRVVSLYCYNRAQKERCQYDGRYTYGNHVLDDVMGGFSYIVSVTSCSGCSVARTYSGINYYTVTDADVHSEYFPLGSSGPDPYPSPTADPVASSPNTPEPTMNNVTPEPTYIIITPEPTINSASDGIMVTTHVDISEWWVAVYLDDHGCGDITTVEIRDTTDGNYPTWGETIYEWGFYRRNNDNGRYVLPLSLRITNSNNEVIVLEDIVTDYDGSSVYYGGIQFCDTPDTPEPTTPQPTTPQPTTPQPTTAQPTTADPTTTTAGSSGIRLVTQTGSNGWWYAVNIYDLGCDATIHRVRLRASNTRWITTTVSEWGYYIIEADSEELSFPLDIRIIVVGGDRLTFHNVITSSDQDVVYILDSNFCNASAKNNNSSNSSEDDMMLYGIIGGVIGLVLLIVIGVLVYCKCRNKDDDMWTKSDNQVQMNNVNFVPQHTATSNMMTTGGVTNQIQVDESDD